MTKSVNEQRGFTLVGLLLTVLIMGILAAIIVPTVSRYLGRDSSNQNPMVVTGTDAAAEAEKAIVANAVVTAMTDAGVSEIGGSGPFTLDMNSDLDAETGAKTGAYLVGKYFSGGIGGLKGKYSVTNAGVVTQTFYPASTEPAQTADTTRGLDLPIGLPTFTVPQPPDINPGKFIPTAIPGYSDVPLP